MLRIQNDHLHVICQQSQYVKQFILNSSKQACSEQGSKTKPTYTSRPKNSLKQKRKPNKKLFSFLGAT